MQFTAKIVALAILLAAGVAAQASDPNITGRWTGTAETTDEAGTKRQEKQTVEIRMEDGKLTGNRIDRTGKPGLKLDVQQAGAKVNLYVYLDFEGGEPLLETGMEGWHAGGYFFGATSQSRKVDLRPHWRHSDDERKIMGQVGSGKVCCSP